jgi:hypothetical protein
VQHLWRTLWRKLWAVATVAAMLAVAAPVLAYRGAPGFLPGIVYDQNFPDPHVIQVDGVYYAYGTNTGGPRMPSMWSPDMETWVTHLAWGPEVGDTSPFGNDAILRAPEWAAGSTSGGEFWAPAVVKLSTGWRAYTTTRLTGGSRPRYCVSVASGPGPLGPFRDTSTEPLSCGYGAAGAIDPWVYVDGHDVPWLLWKVEPFARTEIEDDDAHFPLSDKERKTRPPHSEPRVIPASRAAIWAQQLDAEGTWFAENAQAAVLLEAGAAWERGIIESPALFEMNGQLHLLYSGNRWGSPDYATGWARCDSPTGPCRRAATAPILSSTDTENGPGGASVFVDTHGEHQVAYHAWNPPYASYPVYPACDTNNDLVCKDNGQRFMHIDLLCLLPSGALRVGIPNGWAFCDADAASWMGPGVAWMSDNGITTGVSPSFFAPNRPITRAETVTMLWRWAESPPAPAAAPFEDLRTAFYSDAVAWAAANGIVRGTTPTTFEPDTAITRGQVATILHRAAGSPAYAGGTHFLDIPEAIYFADAVAWLGAVGITTGLTPTLFAPDDPSTRAQFATMLCRMSNLDLEPTAPGTGALTPCGA